MAVFLLSEKRRRRRGVALGAVAAATASFVGMLSIMLVEIKGQSLRIDSLYNDQYHTSYVDFDTQDDEQPTCTGGDRVRVQRTIDYASCKNSIDTPCKKCEMYRVRYELANRPCTERDDNFRERFELEEEQWLEECPCYPACNAAASLRPPFLGAILLALGCSALLIPRT